MDTIFRREGKKTIKKMYKRLASNSSETNGVSCEREREKKSGVEEGFYDKWREGGQRYNKFDGVGSDAMWVGAELRYSM